MSTVVVVKVPNLQVSDEAALLLFVLLGAIFTVKVNPGDVVLELNGIDEKSTDGVVTLALQLHVPKSMYEALRARFAEDTNQVV